MRYETPNEVAAVLARHSPRTAKRILDPAVGNGALLRPLLARCNGIVRSIVCVDSDKSVLPTVKRTLSTRRGSTVSCVHADFLSWSSSHAGNEFDCIVMNPPFAARKADWINIDLRAEFGEPAYGSRFGPVEVAFVCRAVRLLRPGGRLLAVVPSSVVAGETTHAFREALLNAGALKYVHELPHYCFDGVESRMYLFAYDKGQKHSEAILCNHDLHKPDTMTVSADALRLRQRFDFGYFRGQEQYLGLLQLEEYEWTPLSRLVAIHRGHAESPNGLKKAIHTCDYRHGFWRRTTRHENARSGHEARVSKGDILVKRVGRRSSRTFGRALRCVGMECTDCVMVVRPLQPGTSTKILFAVRCLLGLPWVAPLVERGTGASYITEASLNALVVPMGLHRRFSKSFHKYKAAVARQSFREMCRIERYVQKYLMKRASAIKHRYEQADSVGSSISRRPGEELAGQPA